MSCGMTDSRRDYVPPQILSPSQIPRSILECHQQKRGGWGKEGEEGGGGEIKKTNHKRGGRRQDVALPSPGEVGTTAK